MELSIWIDGSVRSYCMGPLGESKHRTFISLIKYIKVTDIERKKNTFVSLNQSV